MEMPRPLYLSQILAEQQRLSELPEVHQMNLMSLLESIASELTDLKAEMHYLRGMLERGLDQQDAKIEAIEARAKAQQTQLDMRLRSLTQSVQRYCGSFDEDWIGIAEVRELTGLSDSGAARLRIDYTELDDPDRCERGRLRAYRAEERRWLYLREDVERYRADKLGFPDAWDRSTARIDQLWMEARMEQRRVEAGIPRFGYRSTPIPPTAE